ncbi:HCP-like protein [Xylariaceae sp. FL0594]|nr:HCP-like protein [Xylariaceae sp. FL0594]
MATASTTPPPIASSPPRSVQRRPLPFSRLSQGPSEPGASDGRGHRDPRRAGYDARSPVVKNAPSSPVKLNFQPENWAPPANATIDDGQFMQAEYVADRDRELPTYLAAPTSPAYNSHIVQPHVRDAGPPTIPVDLPYRTIPEKLMRPVTMQTRADQNFDEASVPEQDSGSTDSTEPSHDAFRESRESDTTASTRQQSSTEASVETSASSVSGGLSGAPDSHAHSESHAMEGSGQRGGAVPDEAQVPRLQYDHQHLMPRVSSVPLEAMSQDLPTPDGLEGNAAVNRHLTPNSFYARRNSMPRPQSSYSGISDHVPRGRSPGVGSAHGRALSQNRRSPDNRASSYGELLNVPYPQPAPAPITLDNSQLRNNVGNNASLLSTQKTLEMYRQNVKKTNDFSIQYSFAVFLISTAQELGLGHEDSARKKPVSKEGVRDDGVESSPAELLREAKSILTKLASGGYPFAQYYLADGYASGLFNKGKEDYSAAFPLFVLAAKHGHAESAYRAGLCYEFGWGCRKDPAKAVQFLRSAASKNHPGAMTRLGKACLSGDLGENRYREGIKWLKRATESADSMYNSAPYLMGTMYETGYGDDIFKDESYAAELFTQAAELGHAEAGFRMGDAYEHGKLNCPRDPALSVHFYTGAAQRGHAGAMMGLCAWYLVGAEPILEKDEEEAYEWARRAAERDLVKAQYTVGYFTEMGIGCRRDALEANVWYVKAAEAGDERAKQRLEAIRLATSGGGTPMDVAPPKGGKVRKASGKDDKECIVM